MNVGLLHFSAGVIKQKRNVEMAMRKEGIVLETSIWPSSTLHCSVPPED